MSKQEKLFLQARNQNGTYEETFCKEYIKRKRGYIFYAIFRWQSIALFVGLIICCLLHYLFNLSGDDDIMATIISLALISIFGFAWLYFFFYAAWFWKYTKHVVVTDVGIWIAICNAFWWGKNFKGKKRFLAPKWSLYSWSEIKNITANYKSCEQSKICRAVENFDIMIKNAANVSSLYMMRWDGVEPIDFLSPADTQEILEYAKTRKRKKKKQPSAEQSDET